MPNGYLQSFRIGVDGTGQGWLVDTRAPIAYPIDAKSAKGHLLCAHYEATGHVASSVTRARRELLLAAAAERRVPRVAPALRVAQVDDHVVVDLGRPDGSALLIGPEGWSVGPPPAGVVWRRSRLTRPLAEPTWGTDIWELRRHLAPLADDDFALVVAWLVAVWMPAIECPTLCFSGPTGSGKTTTGRRLVELVDPSGGPFAPPRTKRDREALLAAVRVAAIDHQRQVVLGVGDQRMTIELSRISPLYWTETELDDAWSGALAGLVGAVADLVSVVLPIDGAPNFHRVVATVDLALGTNGLNRYRSESGQ